MTKDLDDLLPYSLDQLNDQDKKKIDALRGTDPTLNENLQEINNILETVALAEPPITPSADLKQTLLASLNAKTPFHGFIERFMKGFDLERATVEALFDQVINQPEACFEASPLPKTSLFYFDGGARVADATCGFVKIKAGNIFPAHQHQGKEWVLVLQGKAIDNEGVRYLPGDIMFSDKGSSHSLRVSKQEDLIFAVVLEKPNKWLTGRIILDYLFQNRRFKEVK